MGDASMVGEEWGHARLERLEPIAFPEAAAEEERSVSGRLVIRALRDRRWAGHPRGFVLANAVVTTPLRRRYLVVPGDVLFENCAFRGAVSLPYARFGRRVRFLGCRFEAGLLLRAARAPELILGPGADDRPTTLHGPAVLDDCVIAGPLTCAGTSFLGPVSLMGARIEGLVSFENATFARPVRFGYMQLEAQLDCDGATFGGRVDLEGAAIGDAYFDGARFQRHLDCGRVRIAGELSFDRARFGRDADFNALTAGGKVFFDEAVFDGDADFGGCRLDGQLSCHGARFDGRTEFNGAAIGDAFFTGSHFAGDADLTRLSVAGQLVCDGVTFDRELDLSGARAGDVFVDGATFRDAATLAQCAVGGDLVLAGASFGGGLDLSGTTIAGTLAVFTAPGEPAPDRATTLPARVDLRGLSYARTDLEVDERRWGWVELCGRGPAHEPHPYLVLEQSLRRAGRDDAADRVRFEMRRAEARHIGARVRGAARAGRLDLGGVTALLRNFFLRFSVGYGVYGYRLVLWTLAIVVVASLLADAGLRWGYLAPTAEWNGQPFIPYLYAVDTLLPVIRLNQQKYWEPSGRLASHVAGLLLVLGWIIVPLLIAQVTGLLGKKEPR